MHTFLAILLFFLLHQVITWRNFPFREQTNNRSIVSTQSGEIKVWLWPSELFKDARWRQQLIVPAVLEAVGGILVQEQTVPCLHVWQ